MRHEHEAAAWYAKLSPADRVSLDPPLRDEVVIARFADVRERRKPRSPSARSEEFSNVDYYEYLVNHEISLEDGRRFHVCSAHPRARAALACGEIPANFECPFAKDGCPMRALLACAPGSAVVLSLESLESNAGGASS
jgi:hypothetical protein